MERFISGVLSTCLEIAAGHEMARGLEELLNKPEVRQLELGERSDLDAGLNALAMLDERLAESWLVWQGVDAVQSHAAAIAEYARLISTLLNRKDYNFEAVAMPLVCGVAATQLPKKLGVTDLGFSYVKEYAYTLFDAARLARQLVQKDGFFNRFMSIPYRAVNGVEVMATAIRAAMQNFQSLYALDEETARGAASVVARLPEEGSLMDTTKDYLLIIAEALKKLGSHHKIVRALVNPDKAELITNKLAHYPQFPFVFGSTSETPISPSFYLVAGDTLEEKLVAAKAQRELLHQNHFGLETAVIKESMPDVVRKIGLSGKGKIGLLDACTGDGTKFVQSMNDLAAGMRDNKVEGTTISGVCFVDYNECFLMDAINAIESMGIAVKGESESCGLIHYVISKVLIPLEPPRKKTEVPCLNLTLCEGNVESLVNDKGFQRFRKTFPFYITTFLGTTVANFDPDTIAGRLHGVASEYCLVSVYLDEGNDARLQTIYGSEQVRNLSANNLRIAGVNPQDFGKFKYVADVQRWTYKGKNYVIDPLVAVVTYFEATERVNGTLFDFKRGERAPGLLSIKPTDQQFRTITMANGFEVAAMYQKEDVALYLLRKLPAAPKVDSLSVPCSTELTRSLR